MYSLTDKPLKPKIKREKRNYSDRIRLDAVKLYLLCGNVTHVATSLGISRQILHIWMQSNWWMRCIEEIKTEGKFALSNKLQQIADKALEVTLDRLENGDYIFSKDFGVQRVPVKVWDAHRIASDFIDKAKKLDESQKPNNTAVEDRLTQLADAFQKFANKTTRIEVIDAVSTQREERLLQGSEMGSESSGEGQTTSRADESQESRGEGGESSQRGLETGGPHSTTESWRIQLSQELESSPGT